MENLNKKAQKPKKTDYSVLETGLATVTAGLATNKESINKIQAQADGIEKACTKRFKVLAILNLIQNLLLIAILL